MLDREAVVSVALLLVVLLVVGDLVLMMILRGAREVRPGESNVVLGDDFLVAMGEGGPRSR